MPVQQIEDAWNAWSELNPEGGHVRRMQRRLNRQPGAESPFLYCPVVDGYYRDDVEVVRQLMDIVPPWGGRKSLTFHLADPLLVGGASWLGEELFLQLVEEKQWIWHDSKGSMEEIVSERMRSLDADNPKGMWHYAMNLLVENGAITEAKRQELMKFTWRRGR